MTHLSEAQAWREVAKSVGPDARALWRHRGLCRAIFVLRLSHRITLATERAMAGRRHLFWPTHDRGFWWPATERGDACRILACGLLEAMARDAGGTK